MTGLSMTPRMFNRGRVYVPTDPDQVVNYDLVCVDQASPGNVKRADVGAVATSPAIGIVLRKTSTGKVIIEGRRGIEVENANWSWTPGVNLFLGTAGGMTENTSGDNSQRVAKSLTATKIVTMFEREIR